MVQAVKRRQASVLRVQQLLSAIGFIRNQKQISNVERLTRYMEREHNIKQSETEKHLHYAVLDNMILSYTGVGVKGSKTGMEYEGFRIPDADEMNLDDDGHDWYCFECHGPGEMYACSDCWRVFHADCQDEDTSDIKYTCAICKAIKSARKKKKTKRKLLNTLLSYTILRLKEKTRELHRIGHREEEKKFMPMFVYKPMDLNKMEQKVMAHKYKSIEEFLADAHNILHNTILIYGDDEGGMTELARIMIRDCKYDIDEMNQCQNCYYMSNAKPRNWFAQPCDPPHELVYAKLKGFCYWPSKVIRYVEDEKLDVRFFGGLHQRAVIPKEYIKPIDTPAKKLNVKKTSAFVKAEQELRIHQKLLKEREEREEEEEDDDDDGTVEDEKMVDEKEVEETVTTATAADNTEAVSSSSATHAKKSKSRKVSSPEDVNIVTSSEEYQPPAKRQRLSSLVTTASQTPKKFSSVPTTSSYVQTDPMEIPTPVSVDSDKTEPVPEKKEPKSETVKSETVKAKSETVKSETSADTEKSVKKSSEDSVDWEAKYEKMLTECEERLQKEYKTKQQKALDDLSERLQKDFEEDKQQAVTRAMDKLQTELDKVRRQTEDKCREQYKDEMKKLAQKHKETISQTKKKQWCYNCEEEAMYHCCWNTSYCSVKCQQEHWHKEHKRVCRRKR